jgi:hypothetical protein
MPGSLLACCCLLLATALPAGEAWRAAEHPAPLLRPVAGLTRPLHVVAIAAETAGRIRDPGPAMGTMVADGVALVLDDALAHTERATAAAALASAEAEAAFRAREAARVERLFGEARISEGERDAAAHAAQAAALARDGARSQLARADEQLARYRIALPAGWQVLRRLREAGAVVQPGEPVLEVGDLSAVVATLHLGEDEIAALPRAVATVAGAAQAIRAVRVADLADAQSRKRAVEIELPGAAGGGREVLVALPLPDPNGAVAVPTALIRADLDGRFVRTSDGRSLRVTILRTVGDGLVAVLPTPDLLAATLIPTDDRTTAP